MSTAAADPDRSTARRTAIIAAAQRLFLENGYSDTSMSAIQSAAGGSKSTLWSLFPSKEALFVAVLDDLIAEFRRDLCNTLNPDDDLAATIRRTCRALITKLTSPRALRLKQLIFAEVVRVPALARLYYERGPEQSVRQLAAYLGQAMARGQLRAADPLRAADQLIHLCQSALVTRATLGIGPPPNSDEIAEEAEAAVDTFLRAFGSSTSDLLPPAPVPTSEAFGQK